MSSSPDKVVGQLKARPFFPMDLDRPLCARHIGGLGVTRQVDVTGACQE